MRPDSEWQGSVAGQVRDADGRGVAGATVRVYAQQLRDETLLGVATTDADGRYELAWRPPGSDPPVRINLRVLAADADGRELGAAPVRYRAGAVETVDVPVANTAGARPELTRYQADLTPLLQGVPLAELSAADVGYLAAATTIPVGHLDALVGAARRGHPGGELPPVPAAAWYAWQRAGFTLDGVFNRPVEVLVDAVLAAGADGLVPPVDRRAAAELTRLVGLHRLEHRLDQPLRAGDTGTVRRLLATLPDPLDADRQRAVVEVLADAPPGQEPGQLLRRLQRAGLDGGRAQAVVRTVGLAGLTGGRPPMVAALHPLVPDGIGLRPLAAVAADTWVDLAYRHAVPDGERDPVGYAERLRRRVEQQYPTDALARHLDTGTLVLALPAAERIGSFLRANPDFDVTGTPLDALDRDEPELARTLRTVRRLRGLAPDWAHVAALVDAGLHAPSTVAGRTPEQLADAVDGSIPAADLAAVHARAVLVQESTVALLGALPRFREPVAALPAGTPAAGPGDAAYPTLQSLFGPLDACACGSCRSVLSPAAYLVDLLEFLRDGAPPALAALLGRRPDLADLELSCPNGERPLPAVDLVLELHENMVALPLTVALPPGTDIGAALAGPLPAPVVAVLRRTAVDVPDRLTAVREPQQLLLDGSTAWTVVDASRRWSLRHTTESLTVTRPGRTPTVTPLQAPAADLASWAAELDAGTVPADLELRLRVLVDPNTVLQQTARPMVVTTVEAARRWRVEFRIRVQVFGTVSGDTGTLTLRAADGQVVAERQYSATAVAAATEALDAGRAGGLLAVLLPARAGSGAGPGGVTYRDVVLDLAYRPNRLTVAALTYQTPAGDEDLGAAPQHRNPEAYQRLRTAAHPWTLPFDLPLEETRLLLERAGADRPALLRLWLDPAAPADRLALAVEELGGSAAETALITDAAGAAEVWRCWGLRPENGVVTVFDAAAQERVTGPPLSVLSRVSILLQQSGLEYADLLAVLQTGYVRGGAPAAHTEPVAECRPSLLRLTPTGVGLFDRIHRLERLRRRLGWTVADIDAGLGALLPAGADPDGATVAALADLDRLHRRLRLPVAELAGWYGGLTAARFARLFPARDGVRPADPHLVLADDGRRLAGETDPPAPGFPSLADKLVVLAGALRVRPADLGVLAGTLPAGAPLTFADIGHLDRLVGLARALRLRAEDLLRMFRLTGIDPYTGPAATLDLATAADLARTSGTTPAELAFLLRDEPAPAALSDDAVTAVLVTVREAMRAVTNEVGAGDGEPAEALRVAVTRLGWYPQLVDAVVTGLAALDPADVTAVARLTRQLGNAVLPTFGADLAAAGTPTVPAALTGRCHLQPARGSRPARVLITGWVDAADAAALTAGLGPSNAAAVTALRAASDGYTETDPARRLLRPAEAAQVLADDGQTGEQRCRRVLAAVVRHRQVDAALPGLAAATGLAETTVRWLLVQRLAAAPAGTGRAVDVLLAAGFATADPRTAPDPAGPAFPLVRRLTRIGLLATRLGLDDRQLRWFDRYDTVDLDTVPAGTSGAAPVPFAAWRRLTALAGLRDRARGMPALLERYPDVAATPAAAAATLAAALDLPPSTVELAAARAFAGGSRLDPVRLTRAVDLALALARVGVTAADAPVLLDATTADQRPAADLARRLLRGRYPGPSWAEVVRPTVDALRIRQRDALAGYLIHELSLRGADDLYEHSLIDVAVEPCLDTTRLLQAVAAVQLFVHRCLLGQEPDGPAGTINRDRWAWMKTYRMWEANRKVFLWPQNWLRPELRTDAGDAFRQLQTALGQDEPSDGSARTALAGYLDELVELAQVTVHGMYEHRHDGTADLYVVGRTPNTPYRYFWRVCEDFGRTGMRWQPWQRIDLDVTGTHVVPFVLGADLYIAWPIARKNAAAAPGEWEVQLAWARHTAQGWADKQLSRDTIVTPARSNLPAEASFGLRVDDAVAEPVQNADLPPQMRSSLAEPQTVIALSAARDRVAGPVLRPDTYQAANVFLGVLQVECEVLWHDPVTGVYWPAAGVDIQVIGTSPTIEPITYTLTTDANGYVWLLAPWIWPAVELAAPGLEQPHRWPQDPQHARGYKVWKAQLTLAAPTSVPPPAPLTDPDRPVDLIPLGSFVITPRHTAEWQPGRTVPTGEVQGADPYSTGFRERAGRSSDVVVLNNPGTMVFNASPGRYTVVSAAPRPATVWHYRDGVAGYYLRTLEDGSWVAFTDGHPLAARFRSVGTDPARLFTPAEQAITDGGAILEGSNQPVGIVRAPDPRTEQGSLTVQGVSFDRRSPYGAYHWELFLHVPLLVADHLHRQHRFADAETWLRHVFDPTDADPWRFLPFRTGGRPDRIEDLLAWLADDTVTHPGEQDFLDQIRRWRDNPFRPHDIARLRPGAYQWQALFGYLDNLLAWADDRFRRDTRESLVEATMLYTLAAKLLGPRPRRIAAAIQPPPLTYRAVAGRWDDFGNTSATLADSPLTQGLLKILGWRHPGDTGIATLTSIGSPYFCVPPNDRLQDYWNHVEQQLFKIRHCQNIDGTQRTLPLLDPPIDPALLVRAVAAGVDLDQAVADATGPLPPYRFGALAQKANELCAEVKALGAAALGALEKQDAERLARLRASHESQLLDLVTGVRQQQVAEARANIDALLASREAVGSRYRHLQYLLTGQAAQEPEEGMPAIESPAVLQLTAAEDLTGDELGLSLLAAEHNQLGWVLAGQRFALLAGFAGPVAAVLFAASASPYTGFLSVLGDAANVSASLLTGLSNNAGGNARRDELIGGYQRRRSDWTAQSNAALRELAQVDKQLAATRVRLAIVELEAANHDRQLANARAVEDFLRDKYTTEQLYTWMTGELSGVHLAAYRMAADLVRQAERAFRYETAEPDAAFVRPGRWDTLHKGLLAGEWLAHDLKRMELAYLERNRREHELTRSVSLLRLDALALVALRATGSCEFSLPEALFDTDVPGHFLRRLKSVAVSLPCVAGPYAGVHARLTLLRSTVRHRADLRPGPDGYTRDDTGDDARFTDELGLATVVTSGALDSGGVWEAGLHDERRLPFEGRGAVSTWRLELPGEFRPFDYHTITDLVVHLRYSARDGGAGLRDAALTALRAAAADDARYPQQLLVSLRQDFPAEWARFTAPAIDPADPADPAEVAQAFPIGGGRFPYRFQGLDLTVSTVDVFGSGEDVPALAVDGEPVQLQAGAGIGELARWTAQDLSIGLTGGAATAPDWTLTADQAVAAALPDLLLVLTYTVAAATP